MKQFFLLCIALFLLFSNLISQQNPKDVGLKAITKESIKGQLEFLASDWTEGRAVGTKGAYLASDYIASMFKVYGLKPAGDDDWIYPTRAERWAGKQAEKYRTFYQNIPFIESTPCEKQYLSLVTIENGIKTKLDFDYKTDFSFWGGGVATEFEAPVVFVGYGLQDNKNNYNDFKNIDVNGKIVFRLRGFPGHKDTSSAAYQKFKVNGRWARWRLFSKKNKTAKQLGAIAVIEFDPKAELVINWAKNTPFRYHSNNWEGDTKRASYYDTDLELAEDSLSSGIPNITLSKRVANELLKGTGINPEQFEKTALKQMKPASKYLKNKKVILKTCLNSKIIKCRNVLGMIEGKNTSEIVVVGGHYDHLGKHDGFIWNGADDNASGTVGVMTLARAFVASGVQPEKTIIFAAWTAEEKGLFGSTYFVSKAKEKHGKVIMNLNFDMISRDSEKDSLGVKCSVEYTKGYKKLEELANKHNKDYKLGLEIKFESSEQPGGGSDHAPFAEKDIPVFYFMAGFPLDYHQPSDHVEKVNWDKMLSLIKLGYLNLWEVAHSKEPLGK